MNLSLDNIHEMGEKIEYWLRMRVHPIAVKMLKDKDEIPEGAIKPLRDWGHKYSQCQAFAKSQRDGFTMAMFLEDSWCPEPVLGYGWTKRAKHFLEGNHRYPDSIRKLEDAARWCKNMPYLEYGKYKGIVSAPIGSCNFVPDVILMHVNGMMTSELTIVKNWIDGNDIQAQLSGHAACVYAVVPALLKNKCTITIPCKGDRRLAGAQDDEILYTIVPELLPDFVEGIDFLQDHNWGIPMKQEYKEEYNLKPKYANFGERIGMDMTNSPQRGQNFQKY